MENPHSDLLAQGQGVVGGQTLNIKILNQILPGELHPVDQSSLLQHNLPDNVRLLSFPPEETETAEQGTKVNYT